MNEIKKIEVEGKVLYLKKFGNSYRIIHPLKNEDGSTNWFNVWTGGSWFNVAFILAFTIIFLGLLHEYSSNIGKLLDCFTDPIKLENCKEIYSSGNLSLKLGGDLDEQFQNSLKGFNFSTFP